MTATAPLDASKALVQLTAATAPLLGPLASKDASARLIGAFTEWEAWWRRSVERERSRWWGAYGLATQSELAQLAEQLAAQEAGVVPSRAVSRRRLPISWHEGGEGPALLLLNGWTASGLAWPSAWLARLEERFRVIRPDNRGSGWSRSAPAPFTVADMADDTAKVLQATGHDRAVVVGLSMGGMIAQELALRHPARVQRLVVVASQPPAPKRLTPPGRVLQRLMAPPDARPLRQFVAETWAEVCAPGFAVEHPALLDALAVQVLRRPTPRALMLQQMRAISGWSDAARLRHIDVPTVVVHGDADPLVPVGNGMRIAQLIPGATYVELAGVGHLVPLERPDPLAEIIEHEVLEAT